MSFQGKVRTQCPKGCEPWDADVWSFVDAARDERLREAVAAGELNLVSCPECGGLFYPEATVIYYDGLAEMLAFILPEAYRSEEPRWRLKMEKDYEQMKQVLGPSVGPAKLTPKIYFGMDDLRAELEREDRQRDEVEIACHLARELGLELYVVEREFARRNKLPWVIPYKGKASAESLRSGIQKLLDRNDHLSSYPAWLDFLKREPELPPRRPK